MLPRFALRVHTAGRWRIAPGRMRRAVAGEEIDRRLCVFFNRGALCCIVIAIMATHVNSPAASTPQTVAYGVEKIPVTVYPGSDQASKAVAAEIAEIIRTKAARGEKTVLGLATGST